MAVRVTGVGSWPGTDLAAALRLTFGELPDLPYLPELPGRGVGSDMIGRTGAVLADLGLDLQPAGWRLTDAPGVDHRRARARLREDLDLLEEAAQGYRGAYKLAFAGPWTMAGSVEKTRGDRVLADHGARRDLAEALATGLAELFAELRRRLPDLKLVLQIDEPMLPQVLTGRIRTASGLHRFRSVDVPAASTTLTSVLTTVRQAVDSSIPAALHCCAPGLDPAFAYAAGFDAVSLDARHLGTAELDAIAPVVEAGGQLWLGAAPTHLPDQVPRPDALAERVLRLLRPLDLGPMLAERLVLTPACGLAAWSERPAVDLLRTLREAAEIVGDELGR